MGKTVKDTQVKDKDPKSEQHMISTSWQHVACNWKGQETKMETTKLLVFVSKICETCTIQVGVSWEDACWHWNVQNH